MSTLKNANPVAQAILAKAVADFDRPVTVEAPDHVVEAELNLVEAQERLQKLQAEQQPRHEAVKKRAERRGDLEAKARLELEEDGEISSATSVALDALDKSNKQAAIQISEDLAALEIAQQNLEIQRQFYKRALLRFYLHDSEGPAQKAVAELREIIEVLPYSFINLIRIYNHARTKLGWDPANHALPAWYGPAGVLLEQLQNLRWVDWPAQIRPTWALKNGKRPTAEGLLNNFHTMLSDVKSSTKGVA